MRTFTIEAKGKELDDKLEMLERIDRQIRGSNKLTGSRRVELNYDMVQQICDETAKYNIPLFLKNNLDLGDTIQQFPEEV